MVLWALEVSYRERELQKQDFTTGSVTGRLLLFTLLLNSHICLPPLIWVLFFFPLCRGPWVLYLCFPVSYTISSTAQVIFYLRVRKTIPM